jgi:hypothetical protein
MTASVVRLKITLDDVKPQVMQRVAVPFNIKLNRLHEVLQAAMGWTNSHLYEFRMRNMGFGLPDEDWGEGPIDARKVSLLSAVQDTGAKSFKYLYDFGDGWEHSIKIERIFPAIGEEKPMLIEATGNCPPEDVGGHGDTRSSARRLQVQCTSDMPNSSNGGAAAIMMPSASTSTNSTKPLLI